MKKNDKVFFCMIAIVVLIFNFVYIYRAVTDKFQENSLVENRVFNTYNDIKFKEFFTGDLQIKFEASMSDQAWYAEKIRMNYNESMRILDYRNINKRLCKNRYVKVGYETGIFDCSEYLVVRTDPKYVSELKANYEHNLKFLNDVNNIADTYFYYINGSADYDFEKQENITNIRNEFERYFDNGFKLREFEIADYDSYMRYYYKTDCHWNQNASYKAYTELVDFMTDDKPLPITATYTYDDTNFYGYAAREIKYFDIREKIKYHYVDVGEYDSYVNGNPDWINSSPFYLEGTYSRDEYFYHYAYLSGSNYAEKSVDFHNEEKENVLVLLDSFGNAIFPLISSHFNKVYALDHRYIYDKKINLKEYIEEKNIDKVLVIATNFFFEDKVESLEVK